MESNGRIVVVTGATGFVGCHVVKLLLEKGYHVRACVRDAASGRAAFLKALPHADRLSLFSTDLLVDGSFDEAARGAHALIHTAAAVMLTAKDPQKEIIDTTVNGVVNVLRSCAKAAKEGTLTRFVSTSSIAAIMDAKAPHSHVFTEADHNASVTLQSDPYSLSKVLQERAVDDFMAQLPADAKFTHAFVNPGAIYGPVLAGHQVAGSAAILFELMSGKFPMIPNLGFPAVDVRDVAAAHVLLMERAELSGRFLCAESSQWMRDMAEAGRKAFPQYKWPSWGLPNALMYAAAVFDSRLTFRFLRDNLSVMRSVSSKRLQDATGLAFRPILTVSVPDTCQSFVDLGLLPAVK